MPDSIDGLLEAAAIPRRVQLDGSAVPDSLPAAAEASISGTPLERATELEKMAHAATLPLEDDVAAGAPYCQRCEILPRSLSGPGTLHLNLPHTHSLGKVMTFLAASDWPHTQHEGTVSVSVDAAAGGHGLEQLLTPLLATLVKTERRDARAFFQHAGQAMHISDYFKVDSLAVLEARMTGAWLLDILREKRLYSVFQPIVYGQNGPGVFGYECLMRAERDGQMFSPGLMLDTARRTELLFQLDMAARRAAVLGACRHRITTKVFINFTSNAIYDPTHCLDSTVRMIDDGGLDRAQVVFEVTESEKLPDMDHLEAIVGYYRDKGFQVALDDVGSGYSSLNVLLGLKPDYVKLDMALIRNVDRDPAKAVVARKLLETAGELGLKTVAEGVETRDEWDWVREHGADFAQGYYFARPAAEPPAVAGH